MKDSARVGDMLSGPERPGHVLRSRRTGFSLLPRSIQQSDKQSLLSPSLEDRTTILAL